VKSEVLVICKSNWADEMDIDGFSIYQRRVWENYLKKVEDKYFKSDSPQARIPVGTNEDVEYESLSDYLDDFIVKEITVEESATLKKLFNLDFNGCFGQFLLLDI